MEHTEELLEMCEEFLIWLKATLSRSDEEGKLSDYVVNRPLLKEHIARTQALVDKVRGQQEPLPMEEAQ